MPGPAPAAPGAPAVPTASGLPEMPGVRMMAPIPDRPPRAAAPSHRAPPTSHRQGGPQVLSAADHAVFSQAFDAAGRGDWDAARSLAAQGSDRIARELIEWRYLLDETSGASFAQIDGFARAHANWPRFDALLARAEKAMPATMNADSVLTWFGSRDPVTGAGQIRLGEALIAAGKRREGIALIQRAWIENPFSPTDEIAILTKHGDLLTPEVHQMRLERLLWSDDIGGAQRQMARVDSLTQRLAQARIKLKASYNSANSVVANLPEALQSDPALLFDEARALRRAGDDDQAGPLLLRAVQSDTVLTHPGRWWDERELMAREAIKGGHYQLAYDLVNKHGLTAGSDFADAEFLSGWLALRFLKTPQVAMEHFKVLAKGVSMPISRARAQYWLGRAAEALAKPDEAWQHYRLAAENPEAFYGQLALARLEARPILHLAEAAPDASALRAAFEADGRTHAMRILADLGANSLLRSFALNAAGETPDPKHLKLLADLMLQLGQPALAVRVGKQASYNDVLLLSYSHPVIDVPRLANISALPETALILGVTRQESEFDAAAVSHAGALGLMQLMPRSARQTAGQHGLRYSVSDLISDPQYNMRVGEAHLADFLAEWGGSYVLAVASYNAGDTNVRRWIDVYGDPRDPKIDPVDWIELIPFGETRNYVQRVIENTEVYRNRLNGGDQPLMILADLYRPNVPEATPLKYLPPSPVPNEVPVPRHAPRRGAQTPEAASAASAAVPAPVSKPAGEQAVITP